MNSIYNFREYMIIVSLLFISVFLQAQEERTAGEVSLTFTTVTANGNYAPKHVLAVWIEDDNDFIKSRLVRANNRKQYLYTWIAASNYNDTDAVTGATISSHQTHTIIWDCTDLEGMEVADGNYTIHIEFTERHAQGPLYSIEFIKGNEEQHLTPFDQMNFKDIQLDFYPETTGIELNNLNNDLKVFPNPGNGLFTIHEIPGTVDEIYIIDHAGKTIKKIDCKKITNSESLEVDLRDLNNGVYLLKLDIDGQSISRKLIKN